MGTHNVDRWFIKRKHLVIGFSLKKTPFDPLIRIPELHSVSKNKPFFLFWSCACAALVSSCTPPHLLHGAIFDLYVTWFTLQPFWNLSEAWGLSTKNKCSTYWIFTQVCQASFRRKMRPAALYSFYSEIPCYNLRDYTIVDRWHQAFNTKFIQICKNSLPT